MTIVSFLFILINRIKSNIPKQRIAHFTHYPLFYKVITTDYFYFAGANLDLSCPSGLGAISPAFVNAIFVIIGPNNS